MCERAWTAGVINGVARGDSAREHVRFNRTKENSEHTEVAEVRYALFVFEEVQFGENAGIKQQGRPG
jgi:hypothetical protein